jgi:hypothetical protein
LRPRAIHCGIDDHLADTAGAQLLRLRRKGEERIDLAVDEQVFRLGRRIGDPVDIPDGVEPDLGSQGATRV